MAEIAVRNGMKVCGTLFDLHKFFDTVEPLPLLDSLRKQCIQGSLQPTGGNGSDDTGMNFYFMEKFTPEMLHGSAKTYRKTSKGCDHWLATELDLPMHLLIPIANAIDSCLVTMAWAHQILCNLHPELMKASGGARIIYSQDSQAV